MTRGEIRDITRFWLDAVNDTLYFTDTQLNSLINNAQRECQKLLLQAAEDFYTVCLTATTVLNQKDYALPDDFVKLMRLEVLLSGSGDTAVYDRLYPLTRNEQDLLINGATGIPSNFIINKSTFSVLPVPDNTYTLHLWYAYRVADMTADGDEPDVPEDYHEYLGILAARDGFLRDGREITSISAKLIYFETMMKQNADRRNEDSPRMVVSTPGGFGDW